MRALGVEPLLWPGAEGDDALHAALVASSHLLASAAPTAAGDPLLLAARDRIAEAARQLTWAGYLSTTGVYGDHGGGWVDEATPLAPTTERGRWRLAAERDWSNVAGLPLHIFRLAAIYGPGRGPFEKVRGGDARLVIRPGQFMSRIHVDDLAAVIEASIRQPRPGAIYNVCDDEPSPPEDVLRFAARLLHLPEPPEVPIGEADMSPLARSFYAESKRVRNDLIRRELGVRLRYPTYREGLAALAAGA